MASNLRAMGTQKQEPGMCPLSSACSVEESPVLLPEGAPDDYFPPLRVAP